MKQILVSAHAFNMATILVKVWARVRARVRVRGLGLVTSNPSPNPNTILVKGAYAWPESHTMLTQPIDVWWVVHDGGLLLLLSVILRKPNPNPHILCKA